MTDTTPKNVDLNKMAESAVVDIKVKSKEDPAEAEHRRYKDRLLFLAALGFASVLAVFCMILQFVPSATEGQKELSRALLSLIAGGLVGYLTGKASG